jgi:hypothetical protein
MSSAIVLTNLNVFSDPEDGIGGRLNPRLSDPAARLKRWFFKKA